jgi:ribosomal protein L7/L12
MWKVAEHEAEIAALKAQVARLEERAERDREMARLTGASLDEARDNHTSLRKTFNENVDKGNRRDTAQEADIDWLMRRAGVAR